MSSAREQLSLPRSRWVTTKQTHCALGPFWCVREADARSEDAEGQAFWSVSSSLQTQLFGPALPTFTSPPALLGSPRTVLLPLVFSLPERLNVGYWNLTLECAVCVCVHVCVWELEREVDFRKQEDRITWPHNSYGLLRFGLVSSLFSSLVPFPFTLSSCFPFPATLLSSVGLSLGIFSLLQLSLVSVPPGFESSIVKSDFFLQNYL